MLDLAQRLGVDSLAELDAVRNLDMDVDLVVDLDRGALDLQVEHVPAQGPVVEAFEREFAAWCGARHAVAVNSGTAALHLLMLARQNIRRLRHDMHAAEDHVLCPRRSGGLTRQLKRISPPCAMIWRRIALTTAGSRLLPRCGR